jgi:cytochrome P450 family 135
MSADLPPGPGTPMPMQVLEYIRRPLEQLERCRDRYGEPFTVRLSRGAPFVVFSEPEDIKRVFTGSPHTLRSGEANAVFEAGLGPRSLIVLDGDEHMRDRKLMLPPFHGDRMRSYGEQIDAIAEREIAGWPAGRTFEMAECTRRIALEVIVRAVFGVEQDERVRRTMDLLARFLDAATPPPRAFALLLVKPGGLVVSTFNRFAWTKRKVDRAIYAEIRARRDDPGLESREDILSLLLRARDEHGEPMSDDHLRDELVTLLTAGHETTANAAAWALAELARLPGSMERLMDDDDYLDSVVKETLRLRPIVPFVLRLTKEPFELDGWEVPAGVRLAPSVHLVHRRPEIYPEPDAFRPERFLEQPAGTYTWIPFGGGTRRCVGAAFATFELKRVLRAVARAGRLEPASAGDGGVGRRGLTLAPADGARLVWQPAAG